MTDNKSETKTASDTWTDEQKKRLGSEKTILDTYFPLHSWVNQKDPALCAVKCPFNTVNNNRYEVTIFLTRNFPVSKPVMFLTYPKPCTQYDGKNLAEVGPSHSMHLLQSSKDGYPQLCHAKDEHWSAKTTIYQILTKASMWVQAFDFHKQTGKPMSTFLKNMD